MDGSVSIHFANTCKTEGYNLLHTSGIGTLSRDLPPNPPPPLPQNPPLLHLTPTSPFPLTKKLATLGERWAMVCRWAEDRYARLQQIILKWQQFQLDERDFSGWLDSKRNVLREMNEEDVTDIEVCCTYVLCVLTSL